MDLDATVISWKEVNDSNKKKSLATLLQSFGKVITIGNIMFSYKVEKPSISTHLSPMQILIFTAVMGIANVILV